MLDDCQAYNAEWDVYCTLVKGHEGEHISESNDEFGEDDSVSWPNMERLP